MILNYTFEISDEAFEFLKTLEKGKWVDYREHKELLNELIGDEFVEDVPNSWHATYRISDFGKKILELNR